MGCWNKTCGFSGLPIYPDEEVIGVFVNESPFQDSYCYATAMWTPFMMPVRGKYNDYGTLAQVKGVCAPYLLKAFQEVVCAVEQGDRGKDCEPAIVPKKLIWKNVLEYERSSRLYGRYSFFQSDKTSSGKPTGLESVMTGRYGGCPKQIKLVLMKKLVVEKTLAEFAEVEDNFLSERYFEKEKKLKAYIDTWFKEGAKPDDMKVWRAIEDIRNFMRMDGAFMMFDVFGMFYDIRKNDPENAKKIITEIIEEVSLVTRINQFFHSVRKVWSPTGEEGSQETDLRPYKILAKVLAEYKDPYDEEEENDGDL